MRIGRMFRALIALGALVLATGAVVSAEEGAEEAKTPPTDAGPPSDDSTGSEDDAGSKDAGEDTESEDE